MQKALLALEDGSVFHGRALGLPGTSVGEVVFNTAMTGYQEILSDPSYTKQIVTLTYPHIGNVATNLDDQESDKAQVAGFVIRDYPLTSSSWRGEESLDAYLKREKIVAIADIDTRRLTRLLRDKGALRGCITTEDGENAAVSKAKIFPGIQGLDLAAEVTTKERYQWTEPSWENTLAATLKSKHHVVVMDFGVKRNILRLLVDRACKVTVVPAQTEIDDIMALNPDGVLLSNGPGDPEPCDYAIQTIKQLLDKDMPIFGICLGHQLLGLAAGGRSMKMKFGHHGANHPVQDCQNKSVLITSQNHGFAIDEATLPDHIDVTHRSLFDGTLQGMRFKNKPAFSFQGHPEASPGPEDINYLFDDFIAMMQQEK